MPDWESLLREKLSGLRVRPERRDEIAAEMAAHLDELWRERCGSGESAAHPAAFLTAQLGDVRDLRDRIERAEGGSMHERFRHFWMPAFFTVLATQLAERLHGILQVRFVLMRRHLGVPLAVPPDYLFYYPYLALLVIIGAAASFITRRRGAPRGIAIFAAFLPTLFTYLPHVFANGGRYLTHAPLRVLTVVVLPILLTSLLAILLSHVPIRRQPEA